MTLLTEPARIVLAKGYTLPDDADAVAYIAAVEAADGQALETATRMAINSFVKGCKADGIWPAIKASCILAGARTLTGALVPLAGTAPTNFNFVAEDYNRKTGLVGNGTTKYLNSNLAYNATPSNREHLALFKSTAGSATQNLIGGGLTVPVSVSRIGYSGSLARLNLQDDAGGSYGSVNATGFIGVSRSNDSTFDYRQISTTATASKISAVRSNTATGYGVFCTNYGDVGPTFFSNARIAFYSIGENLDLALLDSRITTLINAFAAAIP